VAKAFRERLRACPDAFAFQAELQQLWKVLFRPHDASHPSPLVMTHGAAFEFAINELLLACEERHCMEPGRSSGKLALAPLHFLKENAAFLEFVSSQLGLAPSVSSVRVALTLPFQSTLCCCSLQLMHFQVLPRLLQIFLATGDAGWFISLLKITPPSSEFVSSNREGHAEVSVLYRQVISLNAPWLSRSTKLLYLLLMPLR
jgi:hypothetical protein